MHTNKFSRMSAVALIIGSMVAAPAFAAGNGDGNGNGAGNAGGNSASHSASDSSGSKSATPGAATNMDKAAAENTPTWVPTRAMRWERKSRPTRAARPISAS